MTDDSTSPAGLAETGADTSSEYVTRIVEELLDVVPGARAKVVGGVQRVSIPWEERDQARAVLKDATLHAVTQEACTVVDPDAALPTVATSAPDRHRVVHVSTYAPATEGLAAVATVMLDAHREGSLSLDDAGRSALARDLEARAYRLLQSLPFCTPAPLDPQADLLATLLIGKPGLNWSDPDHTPPLRGAGLSYVVTMALQHASLVPVVIAEAQLAARQEQAGPAVKVPRAGVGVQPRGY